jgi:succinylglutamate desuccinylase
LVLSETLARLESVERSIKELLEELKEEELIAKNLMVYDMYKRDPRLWIDEPRSIET